MLRIEEYGNVERWKNNKLEKERGTENGRHEVNELENNTPITFPIFFSQVDFEAYMWKK